jgi:hypothetical protein
MDLQIIAESVVHRERRLLIGREGRGYIQLDSSSKPIEVPEEDFARLCAMQHYRTLVSTIGLAVDESYLHQVAD